MTDFAPLDWQDDTRAPRLVWLESVIGNEEGEHSRESSQYTLDEGPVRRIFGKESPAATFFRPVYSEFESKILCLGQDLNGTSVRRCELQ